MKIDRLIDFDRFICLAFIRNWDYYTYFKE